MPTAYYAEIALLPGGWARGVRFEIAGGRFTAVTANADATGAQRLPGAVLPGIANCHSHAFHRALRGRTHADGGTFWTWRERMYALAGGLDPDRYLALARATYAEMALAGVTTVGEFHYLHHAPGGARYADPHAMAHALHAAARDAGIRLTLLDACYLAGGLDGRGHRPLDDLQRRFADADADAWAARVLDLRSAVGQAGPTLVTDGGVETFSRAAAPGSAGEPFVEPDAASFSADAPAHDAAGVGARLVEGGIASFARAEPADRPGDPQAGTVPADAVLPNDRVRIGVAAHSVRAVPRDALATVRATAAGGPLHVHLSEQLAENEACRAFYGCSPTRLLADAGLLGPDMTAVHATHLDAADIRLLGDAAANACFCPTTERDLADGIGPARALADAGARLTLGSDQHAVIDLFEEARAVELDERLATGRRGRFTPDELTAMLAAHASLGWPDAGRLATGSRADLVAIRLDSPRTAGADPRQLVFAAGAADVDTVLVDGRLVVEAGRHVLGDVGRLLTDAIEDAWR